MKGIHIEFDVTLQCNFSCVNCNRHSNFNDLTDPFDPTKKVGINLYENTNITMDGVRSFVSDVKNNGTVERIHLIGGEPLVHPMMGDICDYIREELLGTYVPNIFIISNLHPKMLKAGVVDSTDELLRYFPFDRLNSINLEYASANAKVALALVNKVIQSNNDGVTLEMVRADKEIRNQILAIPVVDRNTNTTHGTIQSFLQSSPFFHGIGVTNFKPLSDKHEDHRCTLVAPYDTGQEVIETCDHPSRCGVNYSFDGYWPCSNGSAIARLFGLTHYNRKTLPANVQDWDGVDENGNAVVKSDGMWDLCKLCQVAAKHPLPEKIYGRPISISYRKALGFEKDAPISELVVDTHKKKLATAKR